MSFYNLENIVYWDIFVHKCTTSFYSREKLQKAIIDEQEMSFQMISQNAALGK